jgi:tetratricopeptide (TPR) repeat protein
VDLRHTTAKTEDLLTKFSPLILFFLAATCGPAQYFQTNSGFSTVTPAQSDSWYEPSELFSKEPSIAARASGESISAVRLRHNPPRRARAALNRGLKFDESGAFASAALEFEKAVQLDADFSEAHGDLGVEYTATGRLEEAVCEFQRAIAIDPATAFHHSNLAYTLIRLHRDKEAEAEAQAALGIDSTSTIAHFLLGFVLAQRPEKRNAAETHLGLAARTFPPAHLVLAEMYRMEGAAQTANAELELYRRASEPEAKKLSHHSQAFLPQY